ncbi:MAG: TatD family hydrolase [Candidatus Bathyarchaeia archaeon]
MKLIDSHAHLEGFVDIPAVIERAKAAGVIRVLAVSANLDTSIKALQLQNEYRSFISALIGIHPLEAEKDWVAALSFIEKHLDECVGIGEIGLDYWTKIDVNLQRKIFTALLRVASANDLPVSIHSRGSWDDCFNLLIEYGIRHAVFHWYTGSIETLKQILDNGYFVSATPAVEYSKAHRQAIREAPLDSLLLETDCPVKYHGKESEPADVAKTLTYVSMLYGLSSKIVAEKTTENVYRLFKRM